MSLFYLIIGLTLCTQCCIQFPSILSKAKNGFIQFILFTIYIILVLFDIAQLGLLIYICLLFFYLLFYCDSEFKVKVKYFSINALLCLLFIIFSFTFIKFSLVNMVIILNAISFLYFIYLFYQEAKYLLLVTTLISGLLIITAYYSTNSTVDIFIVFLQFISLYGMVYILEVNKAKYNTNTKIFQTNIMLHHYEEVKSVYLNMRGWKHDYHNHLQSLKAYLSKNQIEEAKIYLNALEQDLVCVDSLVKSGNVMMDAILNSKLSIAKEKNISINETVLSPPNLAVSDVDLCVILANLFDNAIEACEQLEEGKRFIRVYINTLQNQLYISIVNSAPEQLSVNQKNYISEKRGNHGHGMKRVKLSVEKYDGFLNLKNESGVFACEVMLPIVYEN